MNTLYMVDMVMILYVYYTYDRFYDIHSYLYYYKIAGMVDYQAMIPIEALQFPQAYDANPR